MTHIAAIHVTASGVPVARSFSTPEEAVPYIAEWRRKGTYRGVRVCVGRNPVRKPGRPRKDRGA